MAADPETTAAAARAEIERAIRAAFAGIALGPGISLRQAAALDRRATLSPAAFAALRRDEIVDDWSRLADAALEDPCVAFLDAAGFRYYIPALMLRLLARYDGASPRVIATLSALYPKPGNRADPLVQYALLDTAQRRAIANFLVALPDLVALDHEDTKVVARALRNHWHAFVDPPHS
jgi:hypothetical protein